MRSLSLLLRWSWRDLKAHWAKVLAISVVIAIGTGGYSGLTSTTRWRQMSYDASYSRLDMYDLRVDLATGSLIEEGALAGAIDDLDHRDWVTAVEERLIIPTQVDASTSGRTVLVRGEITGSDFSQGGPDVNGYYPFTGRILDAADAGEPTVMLERSFSRFHELPATGTIAVSGGRRLSFVGQASTPEYFAVAPEGEMFMTEATFAGVFTTLQTAQGLAATPGQVNNMIVTLAPEADRDVLAVELEAALGDLAVGTTVLTRDDNLSYASLTTDIDQDQAMFNALALLLIAGAVGAAFNLIQRLAEQQRREIGIGMALGVRPGLLAVRPLLVSAQIALLGVACGVAIGSIIGSAMRGVLEGFVPLPVWDTSFQTAVFARVALLGFVVPFVATSIPVWRAVRVAPIDAIKPSYLKSRGPKRRSRRRSANTFRRMPLRNLARTPRRTALTMLGIGAALTVLVGFLGIMDSVFDAVDTAESEATWVNPDRISVALDGFYPVDSPVIEAIAGASSIRSIEPTLRLGGQLKGDVEIDTFIDLADFQGGLSRPSVVAGSLPAEDGILLSAKAATDLGVGVGESVTLRHPQRTGVASFSFVESAVTVVGTHPHPVRGFSFMSISSATSMGLSGITNSVSVLPGDGASTTDVQRELFPIGAVASVQSVTAVTNAVRDAFGQLLGIIQVMVVFVLLLALLIAFNAAAINLDARAREHATMFAFGVRLRTALGVAMTESLIVAVVATLIGIGGGLAMVWWMTQRLLTETLPDFALRVVISWSTLGFVVVMGVLAVTLAPLLTVRRLRHMDLPGTLRLVE